MKLEEGAIVARRYKLGRQLGKGATGVVMEAVHVHLGERVAIKFLLPEAAKIPGITERFLREGRAAVKLRGEHVARVIDVDVLEDETPFLVMEHLEGTDLATVRDRGERLPIERAVGWIVDACEGLAEAHAIGIVHRDVKPGNLFLAKKSDGSEVVKVVDFGISKVAGPSADATGSTTSSTAILGSPAYMAPEQVLSAREVDARADVWSLGVTLYELLTGERPFRGSGLPDVCRAVLSDTPAPPRSLRPEIPEDLERAILRCLEREPPARFRDAGELAAALAPFGGAGAHDAAARAHRSLEAATPIAVTQTVSAATAPAPPASSRRLGVALLFAAVLALSALYFFRSSATSTTPAVESPAPVASSTASESPSIAVVPAPPGSVATEPPSASASASSPRNVHAPAAHPRSPGTRLPSDRL